MQPRPFTGTFLAVPALFPYLVPQHQKQLDENAALAINMVAITRPTKPPSVSLKYTRTSYLPNLRSKLSHLASGHDVQFFFLSLDFSKGSSWFSDRLSGIATQHKDDPCVISRASQVSRLANSLKIQPHFLIKGKPMTMKEKNISPQPGKQHVLIC